MISLNNLKQNWKSGLAVATVSIPLSISLAIASHATPLQGIITAVWAGLIASFFAGSNFNIIGPTGALSGIVASVALSYGMGALPILSILVGILIFLAYILKLEKYLIFIPSSALHGFTLGVAFIIGLGQLNFALGLSNLPQHEKFIANLFESLQALPMISWPTFVVFAIFLIALLVLAKKLPKFPGVALIAPLGILLGYLSVIGRLPISLQTLESRFGNIPQTLWQAPSFTFNQGIIIPAIAIAIIGIMETMISAKIADSMTKTKHHKRKEMFALSLANVASGVMGGIPATAALARTSLNIKAGATHKSSATISAVTVAIISLFLLNYFKYIPLAVIAAILVFTAIRMVEIYEYHRMFKIDKTSLVISLLVAAVTIYEDPIVGILLGTAIASLIFIEKLSHGHFELTINNKNKEIVKVVHNDQENSNEKEAPADTLVYSIKGQFAYLNTQAHLSRFEKNKRDYSNIILRLRSLHFIDMDGLDAFDEIVKFNEAKNRTVLISGVNPSIEKILKSSKSYPRLVKEGKVFKKTKFALAHLGYEIKPVKTS